MTQENKAGFLKNVRKTKWANVVYWMLLYTFVFMVATKYFIYEDGIISFEFSMITLYQHIALLASIVVGFAVLRRHTLEIPKRIICVISAVMIMFGAIFVEARTSIAYLVILSVLLGQLAVCSLLTYIYEMNNAERLFGIVLAHLLVAGVSVFSIIFNRFSAEFWWLIFALSVVAAAISFFEKKDTEWQIAVVETFQKKLYFPLVLACVGGVVAVCSSMIIMEKLACDVEYSRYFFYGGAALGAIIYFIEYRFMPKPATSTLLTGFTFAVIAIFSYLVGIATCVKYLAAAFAGATFNICMMNLYYILCNIIRKYKESPMLKLAPIVSNIMGMIIAVAATIVFFYSGEVGLKVWLSICLVGDIVVLATSVFWNNGISLTAQEEEYVQFDTTITKAQAYESVGLTDKEIEVADLLIEGLSLREIANKLYISENTAKTHRSSVYKKMQVGSRDELVEKMKHTV